MWWIETERGLVDAPLTSTLQFKQESVVLMVKKDD